MGRTLNGFTLVEVVIALIILTVGVLGLAATTLLVVRQTTLGDMTTQRVIAVQSIIEELKAKPYSQVTSNSRTVGNFDLTWSVTVGDRSKLVEIVSTGPGVAPGVRPFQLSPSVAETFEYRIVR